MTSIVRRRPESSETERRRVFGMWDPLRSARDLLPWDPFSQLDLMPRAEAPTFVPDLDVADTPQEYVIRADLPGVKEQDIEVSVMGNRITISGRREPEPASDGVRYFLFERPAGSFSRSIVLPEDCDVSQTRAELSNGVLTLTVPKRPEAHPRRITLGSRGQSGNGGAGQQQQAPQSQQASQGQQRQEPQQKGKS